MEKYKKLNNKNKNKDKENLLNKSNTWVQENLFQGISVKREKSESDLSDTSSLDSVDLVIFHFLFDELIILVHHGRSR